MNGGLVQMFLVFIDINRVILYNTEILLLYIRITTMKGLLLNIVFCAALVAIAGCGKQGDADGTSTEPQASVDSSTAGQPVSGAPPTFASEISRLIGTADSRIEKINELFIHVRDSIVTIPANYG